MATATIEMAQHWDINDSEAVLRNDPEKIYEEYNYLRSKCPVAHVDRHDGYWLLTKYDDIKHAASDNSTFISFICAVVPNDPRGIRRPPLKFDGKDHTPYRTALDRTLKSSRLKSLEPILEQHAEDELAKLLVRGKGNICTEFGANFCAWVEKEWLHLDEHDSKLLAANVAPFTQSWRGGDWDAVKKASDGFYEIARRVIADRKKCLRDPEEDPATSLLMERDAQGMPLDEEHLIGCIRQALIVAMVAPPIVMAAICKHLSKDKDLQNSLRHDSSLIPGAIEEFVRLYTPYRGFSRTAVHPVTISGQLIPPEEPITMTYAAANRDPEVFPNPSEFVMNRENITAHLGFGRGKHRCAGMPLARMVMKIFLKVLLKRTSDFEICGELEFARLPELGMISCPLKLYPA